MPKPLEPANPHMSSVYALSSMKYVYQGNPPVADFDNRRISFIRDDLDRELFFRGFGEGCHHLLAHLMRVEARCLHLGHHSFHHS